MMKIALGQLNVRQGQPTENLASMREMIEQAKAEHADLIVFPEMALGGYCLQDKWLDPDWCRYLDSPERGSAGVVTGDWNPLRQCGNPADRSGRPRPRRSSHSLQRRLLLFATGSG